MNLIEPSPWVRRAMTAEDRAEVRRADPHECKVVISWMHPGVYEAQVLDYPRSWRATGSTPVGAFRAAVARRAEVGA